MKAVQKLLLLLAGILISLITNGQSTVVTSTKMKLTMDNYNLVQLDNLLTSSIWSADATSLYELLPGTGTALTDMDVTFNAVADDLQQIKLTLKITNRSTKTIQVGTIFPKINGLFYPSGTSADLFYLFPQEGLGAHNASFKSEQIYSRWFPLQFIDVYDRQKGGFYVMTNDTTNYPKKYSFEKANGKTNIRVTFNDRQLDPGETWELPPVVIGSHQGDWHGGFYAYRNWLKSWYKPLSPRKQWFQDLYNFRQVFIHTIFGERGIWDPISKNVNLVSKVEEDKKAFGAVDYVHIFDWMREPEDRIYNYNPWEYLGGPEQLRTQIEILHAAGIKTGLYYQGYKLNRLSEMGLQNGTEWEMLDPWGSDYPERSYYYPCPSAPGWQDYFTGVAEKTTSLLNTDGIYFDQYGFGYLTDYNGCYHPDHGHPTIQGQVKSNYMGIGETQMLAKARSKVGNDKVLYVEEMPTDVGSQYLDGSYTYAINKSKFSLGLKTNPSSLNLFRFVFPGFKTFEMLKVDSPVGEDTLGIKNIFFNGEGIWIEGPLNDSGWFPESVRKLICKTHTILSNNADAFRTSSAAPLIPTLNANIHANYFPSFRKKVWTFFNVGTADQTGDVLKVPHVEGALYYDGWNFKQIYPSISNGVATISLSIDAKDVGCLIQTLDPLNMVLPADPVVVEKQPEVSVIMNSTRQSGATVSFKLAAGGTGSVYIDWGNGELVEYAGAAMSSNVNSPTVLTKKLSNSSPSIKIYTKDRYVTYLNCNDNNLSLLNVDNAPMIQYLRCASNNLASLSLQNNQELILLHCNNNELKQLDVSRSIKITDLLCNSNKIKSLNITGLYILKSLSAALNPMESIDLSTNRSLKVLNLCNTGLTSLDVSNNPFIQTIAIYNTGPTYANNFTACALNTLFMSLPDRRAETTGSIRVVYSSERPLGNELNCSDKTIATGKNWIVSSSKGEIFSGDGTECPNTYIGKTYASIFDVSPNPATSHVTLQLKGKRENVKVNLLDSAGRLVMQETIRDKRVLNTSKLSKGIYFIQVEEQITKLIIK